MLACPLSLLSIPLFVLVGCGSSAPETAADAGEEGGGDTGRGAGSDGAAHGHGGKDGGSDGGAHGKTPTASLSTKELDFGCGSIAAA